jgi:hypothetical protein
MKKYKHIFIIIFFIPTQLLSQGVIDTQDRIFYRNERSFGLVLSTTGYGASYRHGQRINYLNKRLYEVDFYFVRDLKELKITNPIFPNNRRFVFGKLNSFVNLNAGYGKQRELYKKFDVGGIAIRYFYSGGASLGIYKPIYYEILYPISLYDYSIVTEKFNESIHQAIDIYGRAPFIKGLDEIKFVPGIYGKAGVNFEYSKYDEIIHAIEVGAMLQVYPKKIPIMANDANRFFFASIFVSYRFGRIFDPKAPKANKKDRRRRIPPEEMIYFY